MNVIAIGNARFTGPTGWDDLTPKQFLQYLNWQWKVGGDPAGRWVLLQLWYGIRYQHTRWLDDEQRVDLLSVLDFLNERPERWILQEVSCKARAYVGPGDGLDYLTFGEFMHAFSARERYLADGKQSALYDLAAALYRPKAAFWQKTGEAGRRPFVVAELEAQARLMPGLPASVLHGILLNFEGCLDQFPEQYPHLFSGSGDGDGGGTWLDVGLSLARQTSALGSFHQLEQTNLLLVLKTLDALMKEAAELKKKLEKNHD